MQLSHSWKIGFVLVSANLHWLLTRWEPFTCTLPLIGKNGNDSLIERTMLKRNCILYKWLVHQDWEHKILHQLVNRFYFALSGPKIMQAIISFDFGLKVPDSFPPFNLFVGWCATLTWKGANGAVNSLKTVLAPQLGLCTLRNRQKSCMKKVKQLVIIWEKHKVSFSLRVERILQNTENEYCRV